MLSLFLSQGDCLPIKSAFAIEASEDKIDQLYIIQQGGRDVTKKDIIKQQEKAIAKDAESVFETKPQLWKNMGIRDFEELKRLCNRQGLSKDPNCQPFRNMILTTK